MRRVLLLDVMDTLVRDPYRELPRFFGEDFPTLFAHADRGAWPAFERRELTPEQWWRRTFPHRPESQLHELVAMFEREYRFLPGIEALLEELRSTGAELYALSNYPVWWELIERRLALSRFLDWRFVSCRTGVRKPDPRAYLGAAEALGVSPEACCFVDDREANCAAAREVGMRALRFESADALRAELSDAALLPPR